MATLAVPEYVLVHGVMGFLGLKVKFDDAPRLVRPCRLLTGTQMSVGASERPSLLILISCPIHFRHARVHKFGDWWSAEYEGPGRAMCGMAI